VNRKVFILLLICLGGISTSWAASKLNPDLHHFAAIYGGGGYQTMLTNASFIQSNMGVAPNVGIAYRYFRNGFILQVGLEGEYSYLTTKIKDQQTTTNSIDSEGEAFLLHTSFTNGQDLTHSITLYLPIMIGGEYRRFYGLAGAKIGTCVFGISKAKTLVSTQGEYARFIDPFAQMPNHNLEDNVPLQSDFLPMKWAIPSVQVHLELGARLDQMKDRTQTDRLYLGVYADYGVTDAHKNIQEGDRISYNQNTGKYTILPSMISKQMMYQRVNPLTIGIKLTYLIDIPRKPICKMCRE